VSKSSGALAYRTALKYYSHVSGAHGGEGRGEAHGLHDVLERVEADVTRGAADLGVERHAEALEGRGEHERPLAAEERELDGEEREDGAEDARQVDVHVLAVRVRHRALPAADVVLEEHEREVRAREVERPVVALRVH
jgi:hypothetical protein